MIEEVIQFFRAVILGCFAFIAVAISAAILYVVFRAIWRDWKADND